jgi:hypothetical protein
VLDVAHGRDDLDAVRIAGGELIAQPQTLVDLDDFDVAAEEAFYRDFHGDACAHEGPPVMRRAMKRLASL